MAQKGDLMTARSDIRVLDATIRDGGLVNNFMFSDDFINALYRTNVKAGVDYMEFGYKASKELFDVNKFGKWKFCDEESIREIVGDNNSDMKISVMADVGRCDYKKDIIDKKDSVIDMVRVATYVHQMPAAIEMIEDAKAKGYEVGTSLVDDEKIDYCKEMMEKAEKLGKKLLLPVDAAVAASFPDPIDAPIEVQNVSVDAIPADTMGLDIGPETAKLYADTVKSAKTVVWNGPMGVFENPTLAQGTIAVAKALADTEATTIIGGGDSAAAVNQLGFGDKMTHISTGGGASLEFLEGKELPGVAAANDK